MMIRGSPKSFMKPSAPVKTERPRSHGPQLPSKTSQPKSHAWPHGAPQDSQGPTPSLGAPHEGTAESGSEKLEPLDDEPVYPGTCRGNLGHTPQLPGPTSSEMEMPDGFNWRFRV